MTGWAMEEKVDGIPVMDAGWAAGTVMAMEVALDTAISTVTVIHPATTVMAAELTTVCASEMETDILLPNPERS